VEKVGERAAFRSFETIASNGATSHQYQPPAPSPAPPAAKVEAPHETAALLTSPM